jgi:putative chitinase
MSKIDKNYFYENYKKKFGSLSQVQVDNLNILIDTFDGDENMIYLSFLAYILATIFHECAGAWRPISEIGKGKSHPYGRINPNTGYAYYGRGWVQLTWDYNYKTMGGIIGVDLYSNPDLALQTDIATKICFEGMRRGTFTGKKLANYFSDTKCDWVNARHIINGSDRANLIGGYAMKFYDCLQFENEDKQPIESVSVPDEQLAQAEAIDPITVELDGVPFTATPLQT